MRILLLAIVITSGCGTSVPAPDSCLGAAQQLTVDQLEIGAADDAVFRPIVDGQVVQLLRGPQGGDMIGVRLRVTSDQPPECLYQQTLIRQSIPDLDVMGSLATPLSTYAESEHVRVTRAAYVIFNGAPMLGREVEITVECGGKRLSRTVTIER